MNRFAVLSVCLFALTACEAPVVGFWESDTKLANGKRNKLEVFGDTTGEGTLWATSCATCNDWNEFGFDFDWIDYSVEFELDMKCKSGPCDGSNFTMDCEVIEEESGEEKMDCKGDEKWKGYPFDWQRDI